MCIRDSDTSGQSSHGRTLQNQPRNLEKQLEAEETIDNLADTRPVGSGHELTKVPKNLDVVQRHVANEPEDRKRILERKDKLIINGREVDPNSAEGRANLERGQRLSLKFDKQKREKDARVLQSKIDRGEISGYTAGGGLGGDDEEDF